MIPTDDSTPLAAGLRALAGPYDLHELTDEGADVVAANAGKLLQATAFPSNFDAPCGEALHWFRLDDGLLQRISSAFPMVAEVHPYEIAALTTAPFSTVAELSAWRGVEPDELVAALVYENCD